MIHIHFYLRYHSEPGQQFSITGNFTETGKGEKTAGQPMKYWNDQYWHCELKVDENKLPQLSYHYILTGGDQIESAEWGDRKLDLKELRAQQIEVTDSWNYPGAYENAFYTQPFQETLLTENCIPKSQKSKSIGGGATHLFRVQAPLLAEHESICLSGESESTGSWNRKEAILMRREGNWFSVALDLSAGPASFAYKYAVWNTTTNQVTRYENGSNRYLGQHENGSELHIIHDGFVRLPNNTFRGAGVAIPVFALRSNTGMGVGEFADLKPLVDWAKKTGLKLIQLLPLNDTTATHSWVDSYPYAAISAFALHPLFINLEKVAGRKHASVLSNLQHQREALNLLPEVDYEAVMKVKKGALLELFGLMKTEWMENEDYLAFYKQHKHWLLPYAAFCYLRDENGTVEFANWPKYGVYKAREIERLGSPKSKSFDKVAIHLFIQYHLHLQLTEAVEYAHEHGIIMKGDIPIGVYRQSCDVWVEPGLFNMNAQAGAPPDDFAVKGQNWGFPTYNWKRMQEDGFSWWKKRFSQMSLYFDAFRIDHILGFFRIWSIPLDAVQGIMGRFVPAIPIHASEFKEKGIWFSKERYCQPLINEVVLRELFGVKGEWVKQTFVENVNREPYQLKESCNTQRKIESWFESHSEAEAWIRDRMYDLISNVIMFEDTTGPLTDGAPEQVFHFRIGMEQTTSFRFLDMNTQQQLSSLYVDYFFRRQDQFWKRQAMQKLPGLKASTHMLICGEDLGMVPDCVPGVMRDLGFLSLEIQRMPKNPHKKFFHPADAPYMSVVTPGTHDMSTIRGWWQENRGTTQAFFNHELGQYGAAPYFCEPWINRQIVVQHLNSPAMWSILQLQDWLGNDARLRRKEPEEERINVPANPRHYWRYRMHMTLAELLKSEAFNEDVFRLVKEAGRF